MKEEINLLYHAENQITTKMLNSMDYGETVFLNDRFELYKYCGEDYFVLMDKKIDEETFSVQYGYKDTIILIDFWGYDDNEPFN